MLIILVCISLILTYSFVFSFSNSFLYSCHAQQDPTGHVSTSYFLTKVMKRVQIVMLMKKKLWLTWKEN
jgi:hypothetical protein